MKKYVSIIITALLFLTYFYVPIHAESSIRVQHVNYHSLTENQKHAIIKEQPTDLSLTEEDTLVVVYLPIAQANTTDKVESPSSTQAQLPNTGDQTLPVLSIALALLSTGTYLLYKNKRIQKYLLLVALSSSAISGAVSVSADNITLIEDVYLISSDEQAISYIPPTLENFEYYGYVVLTQETSVLQSTVSEWITTESVTSTLNSSLQSEVFSTATTSVQQVATGETTSTNTTSVQQEVTVETTSTNTTSSQQEVTEVTDSTENNYDTPNFPSSEAIQSEFTVLVNQLRANVGAEPLAINPAFATGTTLRAQEISTLFSHTRPNGLSFDTAFETGMLGSAWGENILWNSFPSTNIDAQTIANTLFNQWYNSAGHRENMESTWFNEHYLGIYYTTSPDGIVTLYAVNIFGNN